MDAFPKWSVGILLALLTPTVGWIVVTVIEVDRTQEAVTTRVSKLESTTDRLQTSIDLRSADRFTGTQADLRKELMTVEHMRQWDSILRNKSDISLIQAEIKQLSDGRYQKKIGGVVGYIRLASDW